MKRRDMQTKITQRLQIIPRNRQILLEKQMEKERLMYLKEAKEEIWKRWRQTKGRRGTNPHRNKDGRGLDEKLEKIELEVEKYEEELKKIKEEKQKRTSRIERKLRMERHWEMLRWIVHFMGENESKWREMNMIKKKDMEQREKEEQWVQKNREERIKEMMEEEELVRAEKRCNKEERYKEAIRLKNSWREWR